MDLEDEVIEISDKRPEIGAAEPGALAQPGGTGGGTVYFHDNTTSLTWSMPGS